MNFTRSALKKLALVPLTALYIGNRDISAQENKNLYYDPVPSKGHVLEDKVKGIWDCDMSLSLGVRKYLNNSGAYKDWEKNFNPYGSADISTQNWSVGEVFNGVMITTSASYMFKLKNLENIFIGPRISVDGSIFSKYGSRISISSVPFGNGIMTVEDVMLKKTPTIGISMSIVGETKISNVTVELYQCALTDRLYKGMYDSENIVGSKIFRIEKHKGNLGGRIEIGLYTPSGANPCRHGIIHFYEGDYRKDYKDGNIKPMNIGFRWYVGAYNQSLETGISIDFIFQCKNSK